MSATAHTISVLRKHSHSKSQELLPENQTRRRSTSSVSSTSSRQSFGNLGSEEELENFTQAGPSVISPGIQGSSLPTIVLNHQSCYPPQNVDRFRRRLRFFFMNPVEKWEARRKFPWKLLVQIFKIIVVTLQVALFGNARYSHTTFYNDNTIALSHLFLKNWEGTRDVLTYPPALGPYSVYTKREFHEHIDMAVTTYATLRDKSVGSYSYAHHNGSIAGMEFCKTHFREGTIFGFNESFTFDNAVLEECLTIFPTTLINHSIWDNFDSLRYFAANNFSIEFDRLIKAELKFVLKTVLFKATLSETPDCFIFDMSIVYDNSKRGGLIRVQLRIKEYERRCRGNILFHDNQAVSTALLDLLNAVVIIVSVVSLTLCGRAIFKAQLLMKETKTFFKKHFGKRLSASEKFDFVNLWYIVIIINDVMVILGSVLKIQIENKKTEDDLYNVCSVLLGIGTLLVWFGVLRYFGFFPKYNILILTLRRAAPDVLRFLMCALLMYAGFVFNGWLILGPYNIKFRTLSSTSECLFSLINGDDMFATFAITLDNSQIIWWYSRVYFYAFIALFIYVVISLFISVIMDSYDTIKTYYQQGFPKSDLMEFVSECVDEASSGIFREESESSWLDKIKKLNICSSCKKSVSLCSRNIDDYEPI